MSTIRRTVLHLEALETRLTPTLSVLSYVNLINTGPTLSAPSGMISSSAHGPVGSATASASDTQLSIQASGGDGLTHPAGAAAAATWPYQVMGVPARVSVPLQFSYTLTISTNAQSAHSDSNSLSVASGSYYIRTGAALQQGSQVIESQAGTIVYHSSSGSAPGVISDQVTGGGTLSANVSGADTATSDAPSSVQVAFTFTGVTSSSSSLYPTMAVQFADGRRISAQPPTSPQLVMRMATTLDATNVWITYDITNTSITGHDLTFNIYRSAKKDAQDIPLATATLPQTDAADLSVGHHTAVKLSLHYLNAAGPQALVPDPLHPFVVVLADADGSVPEAPGSVNTTYFRKYLLAVLSHGFELPIPLTSVPAWETDMAAALQLPHYYDSVIPFDWVFTSGLPFPFLATRAGNQLYAQVVSRADQLASSHLGDVVDLHFVGHSRGAVVVSQALQDLAGTHDLALQGSYIKATLLDPHPANISTIVLQSTNPITGLAALAVYEYIEFEDSDPQVIVPQNVKYTEIYYQHSSWSDFAHSSNPEFTLNLWGEGPADGIINHTNAPIHWYNLTDIVDSTGGPNGGRIGPIGHSEVPMWYEVHVVDAGIAYLVGGGSGGASPPPAVPPFKSGGLIIEPDLQSLVTLKTTTAMAMPSDALERYVPWPIIITTRSMPPIDAVHHYGSPSRTSTTLEMASREANCAISREVLDNSLWTSFAR
jgi:hypothetical protein